jgi:hypothetical protein
LAEPHEEKAASAADGGRGGCGRPGYSLYGTFEEAGLRFTALIPDSDAVDQVFVLGAERDGELVAETTVAMSYAPVFGVDVADVANLEAETERWIAELKREGIADV